MMPLPAELQWVPLEWLWRGPPGLQDGQGHLFGPIIDSTPVADRTCPVAISIPREHWARGLLRAQDRWSKAESRYLKLY